jgi:hypothetical protein
MDACDLDRTETILRRMEAGIYLSIFLLNTVKSELRSKYTKKNIDIQKSKDGLHLKKKLLQK